MVDYDRNELELINAFFELIDKHQPDIITGYNIFGFDENYIFQRAELLNKKLGNLPKDYKHYRMSR